MTKSVHHLTEKIYCATYSQARPLRFRQKREEKPLKLILLLQFAHIKMIPVVKCFK